MAAHGRHRSRGARKYERLWALLLQLDYAHHHATSARGRRVDGGLWERPRQRAARERRADR